MNYICCGHLEKNLQYVSAEYSILNWTEFPIWNTGHLLFYQAHLFFQNYITWLLCCLFSFFFPVLLAAFWKWIWEEIQIISEVHFITTAIRPWFKTWKLFSDFWKTKNTPKKPNQKPKNHHQQKNPAPTPNKPTHHHELIQNANGRKWSARRILFSYEMDFNYVYYSERKEMW